MPQTSATGLPLVSLLVVALAATVCVGGGFARSGAASPSPRIELLAAHGTIGFSAHPYTQRWLLRPANLQAPYQSSSACRGAPTRRMHELRFSHVPVWKPGTTGQRFPVFLLRVVLPANAVYQGDGWDGFTTGVTFRRQQGGLGEMIGGFFGNGQSACLTQLFAVVPWRKGPLTFQLTFPYHLPGEQPQVLGPVTIIVNSP